MASDQQMNSLLEKAITELRTDMKALRADMEVLKVQLSNYKGFVAGVCSVFAGIGGLVIVSIKYFLGSKV